MKNPATFPLCLYGQAGSDAMRRKKGEVVGPAGGETGGPRCLAEVRKLLKSSIISLS